MDQAFRTESDSLGEKQLPADVYYGIQTARAVENFPISGQTLPPAMIRAMAALKIAAARSHLADGQPAGRKLDFLMQEFMREANTLCSKAQSLGLTRIGLDLKTVIDQMREQVQNVE